MFSTAARHRLRRLAVYLFGDVVVRDVKAVQSPGPCSPRARAVPGPDPQPCARCGGSGLTIALGEIARCPRCSGSGDEPAPADLLARIRAQVGVDDPTAA